MTKHLSVPRFVVLGIFLGVAVIAVVLLVNWSGASAQATMECEVIDLGSLDVDAETRLQWEGRWTTEDCDSRFRTDTDAHTYRFEIAQVGRFRLDLKSVGGDPYLYLLTEEGNRIADNDDGGIGLDARLESDLAPGTYLIEATTFGGRKRGAADFTLSVSRVTGCDPIDLGSLEAGVDLTASGSWSIDTCGSRFVVEHPAHAYSFNLPEAGRVRIDLTSEDGDPVLSLVSATEGLIAANDDGGQFRNSRIDKYLPAGSYLIEATTYLQRDSQPLLPVFDLVVHLVDEEAEQGDFRLKIEDVRTPDLVVAGQPFEVQYRVGNLGDGALDEPDGRVRLYVFGPRVFDRSENIDSSAEIWPAGVSYHAGDGPATGSSTAIDEIVPFEVTFRRSGPTWIFVAVDTHDGDGTEVGFQGTWRNLMVLNSLPFEPTVVEVGNFHYEVSSEVGDEGEVTTSVTRSIDPDEEVSAEVQTNAVYTAAVRTELLDGIFERAAIASLSTTAEPSTADITTPSSAALRKAFAQQYLSAIDASGLEDSLSDGVAINPVIVGDMLLRSSSMAEAEYASLAASWTALQERLSSTDPLSFEDALELQAGLAYAERIIAPTVAAGDIVTAARAADEGWENDDVQAMVAELEQQVSCDDSAAALKVSLEETGTQDIDGLLNLDSELRVALSLYGIATDAVVCQVEGTNEWVSDFLSILPLDHRSARQFLGLETPPPPPPPHRLRMLARLTEDGRLEHGVELVDGEQVLPEVRYLAADAIVGQWRLSSDVEVDGGSIGRIRTRRLEDGRVELAFQTANGQVIIPDIRYMPASMPIGVWLRTGEIEVPPAVAALEGGDTGNALTGDVDASVDGS